MSIALSSGDINTMKEPIKQVEPHTGSRVLGVWLAPDGNNAEDLKMLCAKRSAMGRNIAASRLSRTEVAMAYEYMLRPSMKYPLCGTTLSKKECDIVDRSYLPYLLSQMGFNKNIKRLILFGPPLLGCFGFTDTFTDQGICHLSLKQEIGTLLLILIEHLQLKIGFSRQIFGYNFARIKKNCERSWLTCLWQFLNSIWATVIIEQEWTLLPQRENDVFLMEVLSHPSLAYSPKELRRLNACRLYLQVLTLTDICDSSGKTIAANMLKGARHLDRRSKYEWCNQAFPSNKAWALWNRSLRKVFCTSKKGKP